jgi:DNA-directed RNA polymerase specialized sigma24 family protein
MINFLSEIFKKHKIWIDIVCTFGCNKETAEDIVQEMYIKIDKKIKNGLDINFGNNDYNYYYIFKTLKTLFLDLKRKESKVKIVDIDTANKHLSNFDNRDYDVVYQDIQNQLNKMYWYDKKVYEIIESGESIAQLSRKSGIPYYSLYNTYKKVKLKLKKLL